MQGSVKRLVEACGRPEQQRQRIDGLTGATATAERGGRGENAGHCRRRTSRRPSSQTVTEEAHRLFVWHIESRPGQLSRERAGGPRLSRKSHLALPVRNANAGPEQRARGAAGRSEAVASV